MGRVHICYYTYCTDKDIVYVILRGPKKDMVSAAPSRIYPQYF